MRHGDARVVQSREGSQARHQSRGTRAPSCFRRFDRPFVGAGGMFVLLLFLFLFLDARTDGRCAAAKCVWRGRGSAWVWGSFRFC